MLIYQYLIMCLHLFYPDDSLFSVQIPSPGIQTTIFVLERRFPSAPRNEKSVSVHFLASQDFSEVKVSFIVIFDANRLKSELNAMPTFFNDTWVILAHGHKH